MIFRFVLALVLFLSTPLFLYAAGEATSSVQDPSAGGSVPADPAPTVTEGGTITVTPAVPAAPRSASSPAIPKPSSAVPAPNVQPQASASEPVAQQEPSSDSLPYVIGAGVLAILGAGFGVFKMLTKGSGNTKGSCDEIKKQLEAKKNEQSALAAQVSGQETAVQLAERKLKEKAQEKIEEKKDEAVKHLKNKIKSKVFGTEGTAREGAEAVEFACATYKELEEKFEQAKKLLSLLRSKHDGVSKEIQNLESAYAVCVSALSAPALVKGVGGRLDVPLLPAKAIIFDWGGVISSEVLWNWLKKNIPDIESKKDYFQNLIDAENKGGNPEGLVAVLAKEADKMAETVAIELNLEQVVHVDMVLLIRALKRNYKIGLLSNANSHLREIISQNNLDDLFDRVLISAEHNMIKPDPAIFNKMLEMLGVKAGEAVFVDDRKKNTDAASALGMRAILFTSHDALIEEFKNIGISYTEK